MTSLSKDITPRAASDGSGSTVIVWTEGSLLNVIRMNASGALDARLSLTATGNLDSFYWDGRNYVAVFHDNAGVHLERLNRALAPVSDGAKPLTDVAIPGTASAALPMCSGSDCTLTSVTENGLVLVAHIVDNDTSVSATVSAIANAYSGGVPTYAVLLPGAPHLLYQRRSSEAADVTRVFVQTFEAKPHAVRH
jgi:hypothetical protein